MGGPAHGLGWSQDPALSLDPHPQEKVPLLGFLQEMNILTLQGLGQRTTSTKAIPEWTQNP